MARKHEKFSYSYGWKTAPEQWYFGWNGKPIQLDASTRSQIAMLMIAGKEMEAEAILKRLLRKQEKENSFVCIGFYTEDGKDYYFTQDLKCRRDNLKDKLHAYKEWKKYIKDNQGILSTHTITSGYLLPDGKMTNQKEEKSGDKINLKKPCIIRLIKPMENRIFQF